MGGWIVSFVKEVQDQFIFLQTSKGYTLVTRPSKEVGSGLGQRQCLIDGVLQY